MHAMSADLPMPPPVVYPQYYYGPYNNWMMPNPLAMMHQLSQEASMLAQQAKLAAEQAALNAALQAKAAASKMAANAGASAGMAAAERFGGMLGDIDFYHNRLCFDAPCKYDPNSTNDLEMEWLRRGTPMRDYPYVAPQTPMQLLIPKPDREYTLVPYESLTGKLRDVYMGRNDGMLVDLKQASILLGPTFPVKWSNFI